jgi:hypothetical protein
MGNPRSTKIIEPNGGSCKALSCHERAVSGTVRVRSESVIPAPRLRAGETRSAGLRAFRREGGCEMGSGVMTQALASPRFVQPPPRLPLEEWRLGEIAAGCVLFTNFAQDPLYRASYLLHSWDHQAYTFLPEAQKLFSVRGIKE